MIDPRLLRQCLLAGFLIGALMAAGRHIVPTLLAMDVRYADDGRNWIEIK